MSETGKGMMAVVGTFLIWGVSPAYYRLLSHVPPLEIMSHRVIWSLVLFSGLLAVQGRLGEVGAALRGRRQLGILVLASTLISANWFLFIYATQIDRVTETSIGYYIYPLLAVLLGWVVYKERLSLLQWLAVGLAGTAVALLTWGLGILPWFSLAIALSFALYGLSKKALTSGPVVSVTAEVLVMLPFICLVMVGIYASGPGHFGWSLRDSLLLIGAGPMTAIPLFFFSYALRRVAMGTVGLMLYMNPTLQFLCAVFVFGEAFTRWHAIAFPMIWLALACYTWEVLRRERAARRAVVRASEIS
ncbi:EamA family transporter RarD [Seohaeicola zhoushanensis]|uniref:Permease n=1 Tax=Seohaeicola zhoushanensis TaxID=1569283 RepID=A0A8J3GWG5_9RHOB|nr:EamA family transporter RarD [Seohaeicola zhoushanensis]GHF44877.1 permease [Seohaeicola zhoushanensis]